MKPSKGFGLAVCAVLLRLAFVPPRGLVRRRVAGAVVDATEDEDEARRSCKDIHIYIYDI